MAVKTITLKRKDLTRNHARRIIALQLDNGNYVQIANGGFTVDFTTMANPKKIPHGKFGGVASSTIPLPTNDDIFSAVDVNGYAVLITQATASPTLKNFQLSIYTSGGTEVSAGAIPAGLVSTDLVFEIVTPLKYD